jgi:peptidyl-prolyl cis-trans isomerase D
MLEAIRERAQGWFAKVLLALITIPFALWGIDSYIRHAGEAKPVASVGKEDISEQEFARRLREVQQRSGGAAVTPEMRQAVLDDMANQSLLRQEARNAGLTLSKTFIQELLNGVPLFQEKGAFSKARFEEFARQQGLTPDGFLDRIRDDLLTQELQSGYMEASVASRTSTDRVILVNEQQRAISFALLGADGFLASAKVEPAAVKAYYDAHADEFRVPEQAKLEYVVLSLTDLMQKATVSEAEARDFYAKNAKRFETPEQRRASHILIAVAPNASEAEKKAAAEKAARLAEEARKNPAAFAELAKKNSQDPGSAVNGGDLGFFDRTAMVKPFADAAFGLKKGEVSAPVSSKFGYHVIYLTDIRPGRTLSFEETRDEIVAELKKQQAERKFNELADKFSSMVYEQPDSLAPVADAMKLGVRKTEWVTRGGADFPFQSKKLQDAVFSDDVLKNKRNSDAVEVAPNVLVSARVVDYKPAAMRPFDTVKEVLTAKLRQEAAAAQAIKEGQARLEALRQGKAVANLSWSPTLEISRLAHPDGMPVPVLKAVFKADVGKLPAFVGVDMPGRGYALVKIVAVKDVGTIDDDKRRAYAGRIGRLLAREYATAYLDSLKQKYPVKIRKEALDKVSVD